MAATRLLKGDSTWRGSTAAMARWQREVWRAKRGSFKCRIKEEELARIWVDSGKLQHEWFDAEGSAQWSNTRGPVGATILSMDRLQWHAEAWDEWTDDLGRTRPLGDFSPKMFSNFLRDSVARSEERKVAASIGHEDLRGRRACADVPRAYVNAKGHTRAQKSVVAAAATNAIWTRTRLHNAGYELESVACEKCGRGADTLHHRLWLCQDPDVVRARSKVATDGAITRAIQAGESDPVFQHAVCPHPEDVWPAPVEGRARPTYTKVTEEAMECEGAPRMTGDIFLDGHCSVGTFPALNRASYAVTQVDADGKAISILKGAVPRDFPQTAQAAEFFAALYGVEAATGECRMFDGCQNVVDEFSKPRALQVEESKCYAGVMAMAAEKDIKNDKKIRFIKVEAHLREKKGLANLIGEEKFHAIGNDLADKLADEAEKLHPQPSEDLKTRVKQLEVDLKITVNVMAAVLPLWPCSDRKCKRKDLTPKEVAGVPRVREADRHVWATVDDHKVCKNCRGRTRGLVIPKRRRTERCRGLLDRLAAEAETDLGHRLMEVDAMQGAFTICRDCGRYGGVRAIGLKLKCNGKPDGPGGVIAWNRVFVKGRHPKTNRPFGTFRGKRLENVSTDRVRSKFERQHRARRLGAKTKPWAAAYLGNFDVEQDEQVGTDPTVEEMFGSYLSEEEEDPFGDERSGNASANPGETVTVKISSAQADEIETRRLGAIRKRDAMKLEVIEGKERNAKRRKLALVRKVGMKGISSISEEQRKAMGDDAVAEAAGKHRRSTVHDQDSDDEYEATLQEKRDRKKARMGDLAVRNAPPPTATQAGLVGEKVKTEGSGAEASGVGKKEPCKVAEDSWNKNLVEMGAYRLCNADEGIGRSQDEGENEGSGTQEVVSATPEKSELSEQQLKSKDDVAAFAQWETGEEATEEGEPRRKLPRISEKVEQAIANAVYRISAVRPIVEIEAQVIARKPSESDGSDDESFRSCESDLEEDEEDRRPIDEIVGDFGLEERIGNGPSWRSEAVQHPSQGLMRSLRVLHFHRMRKRMICGTSLSWQKRGAR